MPPIAHEQLLALHEHTRDADVLHLLEHAQAVPVDAAQERLRAGFQRRPAIHGTTKPASVTLDAVPLECFAD